MIEQGIIEIRLDNVSEVETMRLREVIHTLIRNGSLNIKGGRAILHFDDKAKLHKIEHEFIKWKYNPNLTQAGKL